MLKKNKALILAGTSDARNLIDFITPSIVAHNADFLVSVVSENAATEYLHKKIPVRRGAMNTDDMKDLITRENISLIIDATHPFAAEASQNAMLAATETKVNYIRYERPDTETVTEEDNIIFVQNHAKAAEFVISMKNNLNKNIKVMLSTGVKSLEYYSQKFQVTAGIETVARLLPSVDNLELCKRCNIPQGNIIAMQGPFSKELNRELFLKYGVDVLISKESGTAGSTDEKILAACELGIRTIIIRRPEVLYQNVCRSFEEVKNKLRNLMQNEQ